MRGKLGVSIRAALEIEADKITEAVTALTFEPDKPHDVKAGEFAELVTRADHVAWARAWLDSLVVPGPPDDES